MSAEQVNESRRSFMRLMAAAPVGVATGALAIPPMLAASLAAEKITNLAVGNAGMMERQEEACAQDPGQCGDTFKLTPSQKREAVLLAPPTEEVLFRGIPSVVLDVFGKNPEDTFRNLFLGVEDHHFTRREVIAGVASSLVFAAVHNFGSDGFNTRVIPAPQFMGGLIFWVLQRRRGIVSNTMAHATVNFIAVNAADYS